MKLKQLFFFLLLASFSYSVMAQNGKDDKKVKHIYNVSFYTLKFHTQYLQDTSHVKEQGGPGDYFNSFMNITDYDYNQYKLTSPLTQLFDSAKFVVKDEKGQLLKVGNIELIYISKANGMKSFTNAGPGLSKEAVEALNHSAPGDQIIFRTVEVFDNKLNKQLVIPNFLIVY